MVVCAGLSAFAAARTYKPFSPDAPAFRRQGPDQAKVVIVEFSDLECPACRVAEGPLRKILEVYGGKVRFVFKHFPLEMHEHAKTAAIAAECAGPQGKFWEYHHLLYDKQADWAAKDAKARLDGYATQLKLDLKAWNDCRQAPETAARIAADLKDGENALVNSTPTFFINGRRFVGAKQLAELGILQIDRELRR